MCSSFFFFKQTINFQWCVHTTFMQLDAHTTLVCAYTTYLKNKFCDSCSTVGEAAGWHLQQPRLDVSRRGQEPRQGGRLAHGESIAGWCMSQCCSLVVCVMEDQMK